MEVPKLQSTEADCKSKPQINSVKMHVYSLVQDKILDSFPLLKNCLVIGFFFFLNNSLVFILFELKDGRCGCFD